MSETREPLLRRNPLIVAFICLGVGLFFLFNALSRPTIANMRTIDLLHLLATGGYFGVALVSVVLYFVRRRKG